MSRIGFSSCGRAWRVFAYLAFLAPWPAAAQDAAVPAGSWAAAKDASVVPHFADGWGGVSEPELRGAIQQALWPADIARLADDYLRLYPYQPWATSVADLRQRAQQTARLLRRSDVQLFRTAFTPVSHGAPAAEELRLAALGDRAAVLRLALQAQQTVGKEWQSIGWLQYASMLGSEEAAYALALHFRRESQPLLASLYEARAIEMGFVPPQSLDHIRR